MSKDPLISLTLGLVSDEELSLALEYVMGPQARSDECDHLIVGLELDSVSNRHASVHPDPFLSELKEKSEAQNGDKIKDEGIGGAITRQEAENMASHLVATKLSALLAIEEDDMDLNISFSELGLDSLVAIDFKNWIVRTFASPIQTSEILDATSIRDLSILIVKRSALVSLDKQTTSNGTEKVGNSSLVAEKQHTQLVPPMTNGTRSVTSPKAQLPKLPLPDLETSLQLYLNTVRAFCSDKEFARTYDAVNEFQKAGGIGRKLHSRLAKLANDASIDCWVEDLYNNSNFLDRRVQLVPFGNFFFTHKLSLFPHSQSQRAAIIAESVFKYQQLLEAGELPMQYMNEQPVCTSLNQWLFNAARRPVLQRDTMHKFPGNQYFVTLSRGRVFRVSLVNDSGNVSYKKLKAIFDAILETTHNNSSIVWTGILTADERNSWASVRQPQKTELEIILTAYRHGNHFMNSALQMQNT